MNPLFIRFCILQAAYWSFYAVMPGYITAYMLDCGMSPSLLGVILALYMLCSLLGSLFWGRFVDRKQDNRQFVLFGMISGIVLGTLLYFFAGIPLVVAVLYPLFGFMIMPIQTVLDAWLIIFFSGQGGTLARARVFGTLSYAVIMLVMGQLIVRLGYWIMPIFSAVFLMIGVVTALFQPDGKELAAKEVPKETPVREKSQSGAFRQLLASRQYILLVLVVLFIGMAITPVINMKVVIFEDVGGDVSFLGWDAFIGSMVQILFLMFASRLHRIRGEYRLIASVAAAMTNAVLVILAVNPAMIIIGTCMTNTAFGILFPAMREMTEAYIDSSLRNTAHSLIDTAYNSLSGMIASAWCGVVLESAGKGALGAICAGSALTAAVFCFAIILLGRKPVKG